jgi:hypothetical protein
LELLLGYVPGILLATGRKDDRSGGQAFHTGDFAFALVFAAAEIHDRESLVDSKEFWETAVSLTDARAKGTPM